MSKHDKQKNTLKEIGHLVKPDSSWVLENRRNLLNKISNTKQESKNHFSFGNANAFLQVFIPKPILQAARPVFTALLILIVAVAGSAASVSATFNCLPGDICWNVKVPLEKAHIVISTVGAPKEVKKEIQIKKKLEFAERRKEEMQRVLQERPTDDSDKKARRVSAAREELEESIKSAVEIAQEDVKEKVKDHPEKAIEILKEVQVETTEISNDLKKISAELAESEEVEESEEAKEVQEAAIDTGKSGLATLEAIVEAVEEIDANAEETENQEEESGQTENQEEADPTQVQEVEKEDQTKQEIIELISNELQDVLDDTEKVKTDVELVESEEAQSENPEQEDLTVESSENLSTDQMQTEELSASSTESFVEVTEASPETIEDIKEKTKEVEDSAEGVRDLLEEGNFRDALDKVKDMNNITGSAEQILAEIKVPVENLEELEGGDNSEDQNVDQSRTDIEEVGLEDQKTLINPEVQDNLEEELI